MAINLHESVSFESLWAVFARQIEMPQDRPMARETIVVPGSGWQSYFRRRLVSERGCWANDDFLTLGQWLSRTLAELLDPLQVPVRDVETLTWAIAARLPSMLDEADFKAVKGYLNSDNGAGEVSRLVELSRCIAGLFDQYALYRPQLIESWEKGSDWPEERGPVPPHARWQRRLWAALATSCPLKSLHSAVMDLRAALLAGEGRSMPARVSVWICGAVPPVHLDFLEVVGRHCEVGLYVVSPSHEFWADMAGRRNLMRQLRDSNLGLREFCEDKHIEMLHPLLASWGRLSQDRQLLLVDRESTPWAAREVTPDEDEREAGSSTLSRLQRDICGAHEPQREEFTNDDSLRIHNCHGDMREVEVLRDQLRDALESDAALQPEDIVVLCPDLETYAPLVQAVFGSPGAGELGHMPFHIAGRSPHRTRPIIEQYFMLAEKLTGRLGASEVLDLLTAPGIADVVGVDEESQEKIATWVSDSGVRWALDQNHRQEESMPSSDLNTWSFGMDRLLLGYAMPPGEQQLVGNIVSLDRVEGLSGNTLGKLWSFVEKLKQWRKRLKEARPWAQWRQPLCELAEQMLSSKEDEAGIQHVLDAVDQVVKTAVDSGFDQPVPWVLVVKELAGQIDQMAGGSAFRLGGITFCEMAAMRSVPFKIVALLGMNDGVFPRSDRQVGFDLMKCSVVRGDRSVRSEDKHLFLEAVLAARHRLIITYRGQGTQDGRIRPPAIVVEELLDAIEQSSSIREGQPQVRQLLVVRHPLQSFSPRYFTGDSPSLFSYEASNLRTARSLQAPSRHERIFAGGVLPDEVGLTQLRIQDLHKLIKNPWVVFLERLGVRLGDPLASTIDREPLLLDSLEQWQIGEKWLQQKLAGTDDEFQAKCRRGGELPGGSLGEEVLAEVRGHVESIADASRKLGFDGQVSTLPIQLDVGGVRLVGQVDDFMTDGIRRATYSTLDSGGTLKRLQLWLDYVLVVASGNPGCSAVLVGRGNKGSVVKMSKVSADTALRYLENLVNLYRLARRMPLPFFTDSANAIIKGMQRSKSPLILNTNQGIGQALFLGRSAYEKKFIGVAAADLPAVQAAFAGRDPFAMTCSEVPGLEEGGAKSLFFRLFELICLPMLSAMGDGQPREND